MEKFQVIMHNLSTYWSTLGLTEIIVKDKAYIYLEEISSKLFILALTKIYPASTVHSAYR